MRAFRMFAGVMMVAATTGVHAQAPQPIPPANPGASGAPKAQPQAPAANAAPQAAAGTEVLGVWINHTKEGAVEFTRCGSSLCGHVVWISKPLDAKGRPMTDDQNPDRRLRTKPMCGLQIVGGGQIQRDGGLDAGWIYNPEDGGRYSVDLKLKSASSLQVHGYAGMKFLGETFVWTRAPATLTRCKA